MILHICDSMILYRYSIESKKNVNSFLITLFILSYNFTPLL